MLLYCIGEWTALALDLGMRIICNDLCCTAKLLQDAEGRVDLLGQAALWLLGIHVCQTLSRVV